MSENSGQETAQNRQSSSGVNWPQAVSRISIVLILIVGALVGIRMFIKAPSEAIADIAHAFNSGAITTEFKDYASKLRGENRLQLTTLTTTSIFERTDSAHWLLDVIIKITTPVEYPYYVDLKGRWEFHWKDNAVYVTAPEIKPGTPAILVSEMSIEEEGSIFRNENAARERLIKKLTEMSKERARGSIDIIREAARRELKVFLEYWFINVRFKEAETEPYIKEIYFADEVVQQTS
ncbi:hypothetical protein [Candidatus Entotheonella palauensis]|uniref:hypothetical protein n=1 Tax=Candidatus Entotheonella palauensis TaxID=93172 RepID=UPI000B7FAEE4|nr:hypothetical protein [Candidatus Entotheonella palauensis]